VNLLDLFLTQHASLYRRNRIYYSNDDLNTISQADLDTGENIIVIASTGIDGVGKSWLGLGAKARARAGL
jgi:hypothetical protein